MMLPNISPTREQYLIKLRYVTVQSHQELIRAIFEKDVGVTVEHTKNLNRGDKCCEVVVKKI
jgi:hypothetical protein